jgi:antitoxin (DNA-binding transcriptional repressor) of toxin-antitoxin stability system
MTTIVNVHEAKMHFSKRLEQAHQGQAIIIAEAGRPCAWLVPLVGKVAERCPGRLAGSIGSAFFDPLPEDELCGFEAGW